MRPSPIRVAAKKTKEEKMGLLPIMNPLFNLREICKQMSLLEDHLNNPRKRCPDCIRKHFLTIEALFEEAVSLDKELEYSDVLDGKAQEVRDLQGEWLDCREGKKSNEGHKMIAQALRVMRKDFAPLCFDVRDLNQIAKTARNYLCPHYFHMNLVDRIVTATLSDAELEDAEAERLIKPSPNLKPSRKDRKRREMEMPDRDLQGLHRGHKGDPDLTND